MNWFKHYLWISSPLVLIACLLCYFFADKPVALWMQNTFRIHHVGVMSANIAYMATELAYAVLLPVFIGYFILRVRAVQTRLMRCVSLMCTSIVFSFFAKSVLQYLLGRDYPRYHDSTTLLFVRNPHLYGFHFLHAGSFPSGHMTMLAALLVSIVCCYRKLLIPAIVLLLIMAALLLMLNYHFVSDIIAGTYLGATISLAMYGLYKATGKLGK